MTLTFTVLIVLQVSLLVPFYIYSCFLCKSFLSSHFRQVSSFTLLKISPTVRVSHTQSVSYPFCLLSTSYTQIFGKIIIHLLYLNLQTHPHFCIASYIYDFLSKRFLRVFLLILSSEHVFYSHCTQTFKRVPTFASRSTFISPSQQRYLFFSLSQGYC